MSTGNESLELKDPELFDLIEREKTRQWHSLELIASENFTSRAVLDCLGSALTNKYSEGFPHKRYYGGNEIIDQIEELCQKRSLAAYGLNPNEWGVNVQPYSGSPANFAVYTALLRPHERIMGLDLPSGGHLTHGFYTYNSKDKTKKAVSATSIYFESMPYRLSPETGLIDFEILENNANLFKPNLLICGGSAYPREWDYNRFRKIADNNGSILMCDMSHISGLVAAGEAESPFNVCDIVTTTTHKTLRGPRAGIIFYRKDSRNFEEKINNAIFPSLQGGPHDNTIAAICTQMLEVSTPEFKNYAKQVRKNINALANKLIDYGYTICTNGTDNHLILWNLRPQNISGLKMEKICDAVSITLNKNSVLGDKSAISPSGVRIGSPALTTRGFLESDFEKIGEFLHRTVQIAILVQSEVGEKIKDFESALKNRNDVNALRDEIHLFTSKFPMPGFDVSNMKYKSF